jgi:tRNA (guanine26-N2/guanine27-N2)-dimethyltransferase
MVKKKFLKIVCEGSTEVFIYKNKEKQKGPGNEEGIPFFNPSMELNRDLSILFGQWLVDNSKGKTILLDGLAASGIRGIRFANEIEGDFKVVINDWDEDCYKLINKNIEKHNFKNVRSCKRNINALLSEKKFDYIDVDPFGSPVSFIDSAIRGIKNNGILACTATDTATLCGVYPKVCLRRYGAFPFHSIVMKEIALRILVGLICRTAGAYDKGIQPLISYSSDHYFRTYIRIISSVSNANSSMRNFKMINSGEYIGLEKTKQDIGPIWLGKLQNKNIISFLRTKIFEKKLKTKNSLWKLLDLIEEEAEGPYFFYTTESLASILKTPLPKLDVFFKKLKKQGYMVYRTHFSPTSFKTDASLNKIKELF